MTETVLLTLAEAGLIAGIPTEEVAQLAETELLPTFIRDHRKKRLITLDGALCVVLAASVASRVGPAARQRIFRTLAGDRAARSIAFTPTVRIEVDEIRRMVLEKLTRIRTTVALVDTDPEILGGEPHLRGTRIPASLIVTLLDAGATVEELLEDYPSLSPILIEAARYHDRLVTARPRIEVQPWHRMRPDVTRRTRRAA